MPSPFDRFVEQRFQTDHRSRPRLEWLPIVAKNRSKTDVIQLGMIDAYFAKHIKQLLKVFALSMVDHVERHVGFELALSENSRGDIRGRIQIGTILLANDHRCFVAIQEQADRTIALHSERSSKQVLNHPGQQIMVITFAVFVVKLNIESAIDAMNLGLAIR